MAHTDLHQHTMPLRQQIGGHLDVLSKHMPGAAYGAHYNALSTALFGALNTPDEAQAAIARLLGDERLPLDYRARRARLVAAAGRAKAGDFLKQAEQAAGQLRAAVDGASRPRRPVALSGASLIEAQRGLERLLDQERDGIGVSERAAALLKDPSTTAAERYALASGPMRRYYQARGVNPTIHEAAVREAIADPALAPLVEAVGALDEPLTLALHTVHQELSSIESQIPQVPAAPAPGAAAALEG
jgi:hypothetical protein